MGTEVEYGISVPDEPGVNPVVTSTQVVLAYAASVAAPRARRPRWDYEVESPLRDARGYDLSRLFGPAVEPDVDDIGAANVILSNGARLYVDHAHPEFSSPEVTNPLDAVLFDKAGERVMEAAALRPPPFPARDHCSCTRTTSTARVRRTAPTRTTCAVARPPFPSIISGLMPFFAPGRCSPAPAGSASVVRADRRIPAVPALRLHRGRGRAGDHAQARASSTPATNRTPTPTSTAGCTSSSATRTSPRPPPTSSSAPPPWCSR